ncbi:MAG: hypothetical protein ACTSPK_06325, partial [Candidatus Heimdallarchaeota archaeon]
FKILEPFSLSSRLLFSPFLVMIIPTLTIILVIHNYYLAIYFFCSFYCKFQYSSLRVLELVEVNDYLNVEDVMVRTRVKLVKGTALTENF